MTSSSQLPLLGETQNGSEKTQPSLLKINFKRLFTLIGICCLLWLIFFALAEYSMTSDNFGTLSLKQPDPFNKKYLTSNLANGIKGGIGNILFELVSLISIAKTLHRIPFIHVNNTLAIKVIQEKVNPYFPILTNQIRIFDTEETIDEVLFHNRGCCIFDDPERLRGRPSKYLQINGGYFQSVKYFDHIREMVREWLTVDKKFHQYAIDRLPSDMKESFKICLHIRRGDFVITDVVMPSDFEFTRKATLFLMEKYSTKNPGIVVFGDDPDWATNVLKGINNTHVMNGTTTIEDLAFSKSFCDIFLTTATQSTFGFWLAYLTKSDAQVHYTADFIHPKSAYQFNPNDFFPSMWKRLTWNNSEIVEG